MDSSDVSKWKETFFQSTFSVDQCLMQYTQTSDLETIRTDLKNYGSKLQLHMSEILKNETEAIANLAEYLTNLNSKIDDLSVPISQLKEEIRTLYELIKTATHGYEEILGNIKNNNSRQNHIYLKLGIINSSIYINSVIGTIEANPIENLLTLERIVTKYSFQKIYLDELQLRTPDIEKNLKNVEGKLVSIINNCFIKSCKEQDQDIILRCLRMYIDLQKQEEAHQTFRKHIIRPAFQVLFTEKYLEECGYDLNKIYMEVKKILEKKVELLDSVVKVNIDLNSFNFVINSFWKEFDKQSREGLPHITAPGNPELFQKRFTHTYSLLKYIAEKANNEKLIKDDSFQSHLKRFNLPVYFEIKFQQIAGNFEGDTINITFNQIAANKNDLGFKLKPSEILWNSLTTCFNEDVYIDHLANHFVRLSMMLLCRYIKLLEKLLEDIVASDTSKEDVSNFIVDILIDLSILESLIAPSGFSTVNVGNTIFAIVNSNMWNVILKMFELNAKLILNIRNKFKNHIITSIITECISQLQNVTAIPRLYRRTNRSPPKEASSYMVEAVKPVLGFKSQFKGYLDNQFNDIVNSIILSITNQYLTLAQEVLMSVCKTEESLRRLKSRTINTSSDDSSHGTPDTMSDETKIREQIKFDVGYFCDKLNSIAMAPAKEAMQLLKTEVYK
ncbi:unnamed protein product [Ceutorhynchus assimilis]|uniref:COG complex component COG2 C-terminal domain-containing protein n=1 Tax=Ceutorhynchus assimilis TaxID=467358 RepID=A0A9N9MG70_9CUCU|nr:unnamed protein product [Ceutorhynchus assimilis]